MGGSSGKISVMPELLPYRNPGLSASSDRGCTVKVWACCRRKCGGVADYGCFGWLRMNVLAITAAAITVAWVRGNIQRY